MYFAVNHEIFMSRCFDLARKGAGKTAPNPQVGSVIICEDKIIGEGFHEVYGGAHAEVNAIANVKDKSLFQNSTLYVNLEPCSHFGKTPPCADLIIKHQIPRVVVSNLDPNPAVAGQGIQKLRDAGIEVKTGFLEDEGAFLNRRFFTFHTKKRPFIILKQAKTADGFVDSESNSPLKISNRETDRLLHKIRAEEHAILVGFNTALKDNPSLTVRFYEGKNPQRFVFDPHLELPEHLIMMTDSEPIHILNFKKDGENGKIHYYKIDENQPAKSICDKLYELGILSLIVEGGSKTHTLFSDANLWDEAIMIISTQSIQKGVKAFDFKDFRTIEKKEISDNEIWYLKNIKS